MSPTLKYECTNNNVVESLLHVSFWSNTQCDRWMNGPTGSRIDGGKTGELGYRDIFSFVGPRYTFHQITLQTLMNAGRDIIRDDLVSPPHLQGSRH